MIYIHLSKRHMGPRPAPLDALSLAAKKMARPPT